MDLFAAIDHAGRNFAQGVDWLARDFAKNVDGFGRELAKNVDGLGRDFAKNVDGLGRDLAKNADRAGRDALRCFIDSACQEENTRGSFKEVSDHQVGGIVHRFVDAHPVLGGMIATSSALAVTKVIVPHCLSALGFGPAGPVVASLVTGWMAGGT